MQLSRQLTTAFDPIPRPGVPDSDSNLVLTRDQLR
jgi:hypothetical protein